MNLTQEKALFHMAGKLRLSELSREQLQALTEEYPWFAPARFFLAAQSKNSQTDWLPEAQKAALYFTNPDWLQYQLNTIDDEPAPAAPAARPVNEAIHTVESVREKMRTLKVEEEAEEPDNEKEPVEDGRAAENKISGMLSEQLADFRRPLDPGAMLEIENEKKRLHTIDYFASQGIKIDLSSIPQDKLTTHLRKFTDWLKQIKTANTVQQEFASTPEMEKAVAETARNSNEIREVVTEAMADVLVKQGQADKAIQLYIKLSFLIPEKSSYFAAKIEQLKGI